MQMNDPARKPADDSACITELHAAGPMTVQQCVQFGTFWKRFRSAGRFPILSCFGKKRIQVIETGWIEQPEACKMACHAELFRCRRKQKEACRPAAEFFNQLIFRTRALR